MSYAMIFPGQGSQSLTMLNGFLNDIIVKNIFVEASDIMNYDLMSLLNNTNEKKINHTIYTQPLLLTTNYAFYQLWLHYGGKIPALVAGHSLGEYSALLAAQVSNFRDLLELVVLRAQLMQNGLNQEIGAMAAILGLDDHQVEKICFKIMTQTNDVVQVANYNSPLQIVIAGKLTAINLALLELKNLGAKIKLLPISVAAHCDLMNQVATELAVKIEALHFKSPSIPIYQNYAAMSYDDVILIKQALIDQLFSPVLWKQTITTMMKFSHIFVECGPNKVLTGLNKRINPQLINLNFANQLELEQVIKKIEELSCDK